MATKKKLPRNQPPASERYRAAAVKVEKAARLLRSACSELEGLAWFGTALHTATEVQNLASRFHTYADLK